MSLKDLIRTGYVDGSGLVAPEPTNYSILRSSDNGPLFTSQYLILQRLAGEELDTSALKALQSCIDDQGYLRRVPNDPTEDAPDDHYGVLSAFVLLNLPGIGPRLPLRCLHPVLIYLKLLSLSPMLRMALSPIRTLMSPIVALIIAFSNHNSDPNETSNKLLTWTFIQAVASKSILCRLAGKVWHNKMVQLYDTKCPMGVIAKIYYSKGHPFITYFENL